MALDNLPEYRQGAFGDCEFCVITSRPNFGHRVAVHEYPHRQEPWTEPMGRKVRIFRVQGGIWGEDHAQLSRKLVDKSECGAIETYVDPVYGEFQCRLIDCNITHNPEGAGGQTLLDLTFVEAGSLAFPSVQAAQGSNIAGGLVDYVNIVFTTLTFQTTSLFDTSLFRFIEDTASLLRRLFNRHIDWNGQSVDVVNLIDGMIANPSVSTTDTFSDIIRQAIEGLFAFGTDDAASLSALCELLSYGEDETGTACEYALYVRLVAVGYAAEAAIQNGYTNPVEAIAFMECLIAGLERDAAIASEKCFDEIYSEIQCLITAISQDFTFIALGLPPIINTTLCGSLPSIVAAFQIYGNLDSLDAFEELNGLRDNFNMPADVLYQAQ